MQLQPRPAVPAGLNASRIGMGTMSFEAPSSGARHEMQRYGIHAVTQASRPGAVIKHVPQVRVAQPARDCIPLHAEAVIRGFNDIDPGDGLPEARPAGSGIKLRAGIVKSGVATDAPVYPIGLVVIVFAGERHLSACLTCDVKGGG